MRIKLGDYGGKVAPTVPDGARTNPRAAFVDPDSGAVDKIAAAAGGLLADERSEQRRLQLESERQRKHDEEQGRRNKSAAAFAQYQVDSENLAVSIGNKLTEGQVKREDAEKELDKGLADLRKARIEPLDQASRDALADNLIRFDGHARLKFGEALTKHARQERAAGFVSAIEGLERLGVKDPKQAILEAGVMYRQEGAAIYGQETATKHLQNFTERVTYTHAYSGITAAMNDPKGLAAWAEKLKSEEFASMDPKNRESLIRSVQGSQLRLEQRAEVLAVRAERKALVEARKQEQEFTGFQQFIDSGKAPSETYLRSTLDRLKGSPFEAAVVELMEQGKSTAAWASAPLAAQRAGLVKLRGEANVSGSDPAREKRLGKLETITKAAEEDLRRDPMPAAVERGVIRQLAPLDFTDVKNIRAQFAERNRQADMVDQWAGRPVSPLTNDEAAGMARLLAPLKPDAKAEALKVIGSSVPPARMRALAAQIDPADKTLATAMLLASRDREGARGASVAQMYLKGVDAIHTKTAKIDDKAELGVRADAAKAIEGVYLTPGGRDAALEAVRGVYAAMKMDGRDSVSEAVRIVTGGVMEHNGGKIAKPAGWSDGIFRDTVRGVTAEDLRRAGGKSFSAGRNIYTPDEVAKLLPGARLQTVDYGRYAVVVGTEFLRQADGAPFVLRLR